MAVLNPAIARRPARPTLRVRTGRHSRVKLDDIVSFFQQFGTLLGAGTPLLAALNIVQEQCESVAFSRVLRQLAGGVAAGSTLHAAMAKQPAVFEHQWVEMVKAGERSGQLLGTILGLGDYIKTRRAIRSQIVSSLIYPCILLGVLGASLVIMLGTVVPTFADFLKDFGTELPWITQLMITLSEQFKAHLGAFMMAPALLVLPLRSYLRTPKGRWYRDVALIRFALTRRFVVDEAMERFSHNLALLLRAGTPLLEALNVVTRMFPRHGAYASAVAATARSVGKGAALGDALEQTGLFTPLVVNMVRVGEQAGTLNDVLEEVSTYYRARVEVRITRMTSLLEPAIVIVLGVTVGVILLSVYLPMFQMASGPIGQ